MPDQNQISAFQIIWTDKNTQSLKNVNAVNLKWEHFSKHKNKTFFVSWKHELDLFSVKYTCHWQFDHGPNALHADHKEYHYYKAIFVKKKTILYQIHGTPGMYWFYALGSSNTKPRSITTCKTCCLFHQVHFFCHRI